MDGQGNGEFVHNGIYRSLMNQSGEQYNYRLNESQLRDHGIVGLRLNVVHNCGCMVDDGGIYYGSN